MQVDENRLALESLFAVFDRVKAGQGLDAKHLAILIGVDPSQVKRWRNQLAGKGRVTLKKTARNAIASLGEKGAADVLEAAVRQMRGTVEDLEGAARLRRAFLTERSQDGKAVAGAAGRKAMERGKGPGKKQTKGGA